MYIYTQARACDQFFDDIYIPLCCVYFLQVFLLFQQQNAVVSRVCTAAACMNHVIENKVSRAAGKLGEYVYVDKGRKRSIDTTAEEEYCISRFFARRALYILCSQVSRAGLTMLLKLAFSESRACSEIFFFSLFCEGERWNFKTPLASEPEEIERKKKSIIVVEGEATNYFIQMSGYFEKLS